MNKPSPTPNQPTEKAWYRHAYLWLVILLPLLAVVVSISFARTAFLNKDDIVRDDWYMDGKTLQQDLSRDRYAQQAGFSAQLLNQANQKLQVQMQAQRPTAWPALLWLNLYHPTHAKNDLKIILRQTSDGQYEGQLPANWAGLSGKYHLELEDGDTWRLQSDAHLPLSQLQLKPLLKVN